MKHTLTPHQIAARDARREKFRALWKRVAAMPEMERITLMNRVGIVNVEGYALSCVNSCLLALQCPNVTVVGGFRQWIDKGRAVRKGEHGHMIFIPLGRKSTNADTGVVTTEMDEKRFTTATVFDISQTEDISQRVNALEMEQAA